jgi:Golgi nucleoside diphosphatase
MKIIPGLSTFSANPDAVTTYLKPLLDFAKAHIPVNKQPSALIYLLATGGMRLIPIQTRDKILQIACEFVSYNYLFSTKLGCKTQFLVISGELEGIFSWISLNYLYDRFENYVEDDLPSTFGLLEMGGASTQIAFEPTKIMAKKHADGFNI